MNEDLLKLQEGLSTLSIKDNLISVIIYGSGMNDLRTANDLDVIIVVKKINSELYRLFGFLFYEFKNIDFNLYTHDEVINGLSFYTREYKLEYQAKGVCLYGENILENELLKVSGYSYKQSILIRSIEHLQMVRKVYFAQTFDDVYKLKYLDKYFQRISKNILLFMGLEDHHSLDNLSDAEVMQKLIDAKILNKSHPINDKKTPKEYFLLFRILSEHLIKCKNKLDNIR